MNILVIGQNGREHALALTYAKSKKVKKVFITPGNGLTDFTNKKIINYPDIQMVDFDGIIKVCKKEKIDLVDVAQDDVIAAGYVDRFESLGIPAFGPTKKASQLEWDKKWAREFMKKYNLPIPRYETFSNPIHAKKYVKKIGDQLLFIKASGLALGKGVLRAENTKQAIEAIDSMKQFGKAGETFLVEEGLVGEEFSLFAICDGKNYIVAKSAQDHKTVYNQDAGPNTGGMGSVAPTGAINNSTIRIIEQTIIQPLLKGMIHEKREYKGILYIGGMVTKSGVKIIEFNCRWGDPEAEVILPSIQTDYVDIVQAVIKGALNKTKITFDNKLRISIAACSQGYPINYSQVKGKEIFGIKKVLELPGIIVFGSGIKRMGNRFFANGGRLFYIVSEANDIVTARKNAYAAMSLIYIEGNNLHYRTDIGWRELERNI